MKPRISAFTLVAIAGSLFAALANAEDTSNNSAQSGQSPGTSGQAPTASDDAKSMSDQAKSTSDQAKSTADQAKSTMDQATSSDTKQPATADSQMTEKKSHEKAHGTMGKTSSSLSNSEVRQIQQNLKDKGYQTGQVDGVMGKNTTAALKKFQQDQGMSPTGTPDSSTLAALGVTTTTAQAGEAGMSESGMDSSDQQAGMSGKSKGDSMSDSGMSQPSGDTSYSESTMGDTAARSKEQTPQATASPSYGSEGSS